MAPAVFAVLPAKSPARVTIPSPAPSLAPAGELRSALIGTLLSDTAPGPLAPAESPALWAVLGWVRRRSSEPGQALSPHAAAAALLPAAATGLNPVATVGVPDANGVVTGVVTATQILDYPLTYSVTAVPSRGSLQFNGDGTFIYTPTAQARYAASAGGVSQDSFTITADDLSGDVASVVVQVPIAANSDPLGLHPTATVGTPDDAGVVTGHVVSDPAGDLSLTYSGSATTSKGTVEVDPSGSFRYTPTVEARHAAGATDASGTGADRDSFTITVDAGNGALASTTVTVPISAPAALNPVATVGVPDDDGVVAGAVTTTQTVGYPPVYSVGTGPSRGSLQLNGDGTFTYTPSAQSRYAAAGGGVSQDSFTITADNSISDVASVVVSVPIAASSDPLGLHPTSTVSTPDSAGVVTGHVQSTPAIDVSLTYSGSITTAKGTVVVNPDGSFRYTPTVEARQGAGTGDPGAQRDSFVITVDAGNGAVAGTTVTVAINPPTVMDPVATVGASDDNGVITGAVTTTPIADYPLVYSGSTRTSTGAVVVHDDGTFTYTPLAQARYAAAGGGASQDHFTITVNDLHGDSGTVMVQVPISASSDPLGLHPTATMGTPDDAGVVTGRVESNSAVDGALTYWGSTTTSKGTVVVNPDGTFIYTPTEQARQTAAAADAADLGADWDQFTIAVDVGGQEMVSTVVAVPIRPAANDIAVVVPDVVVPAVVVPAVVVPAAASSGGGASVAAPAAAAPVVVAAAPEEEISVPADAGTTKAGADNFRSVSARPASQRREPRSPLSNRAARTGASAPAAPLSAGLGGRTAPSTPPTVGPAPLAAVLPPAVVIQLQVALFSLVSMLGGGAMLRGVGGLSVAGNAGGSSGGRLAAVRAGKFTGATEYRGIGDVSRSWRWPGTARIDAALRTASARVAPHSPLLARITVDGSAIRAIFGSAAMLLPVAGVALAGAAVRQTGGMAIPPSAWLVTAIAVLGVFDALAGFLAVTVFIAGVAISGHLGATDIRTMLGLSVSWFAVPLIAGAARPLRRSAARTVADWRSWVGDLVIASLIGAWAIQKMITALPGLAGTPLPIAGQATKIAVIVLAACALRIVVEASAARWYPGRLTEVQPAALASPPVAQRILAACGRTALLMFVAAAFLGMSWQLWAGALLFLLPQLFSAFDARLPNFPTLYRVYPRGIVKLVLMLAAGLGIAAVVHRVLEHSAQPVLDSFVLLSIPGAILGIVEAFGREGPSSEETWPRWLAGAGFVGAGMWLVLVVM